LYAVEAANLVKVYEGRVRALDGISFQVEPGEIFGLIGPNGAGKTTTLRIVATLLRPTEGAARVFGYDVVNEADKVRRIISYLPEEAGAYRNLSGLEYLRFVAGFYSEDKDAVEEMVSRAVEISGLSDKIHERVKGYSKGMKRRLLVARTLMVLPRLAIMDEPTSGLDVVHAIHVREIIKDYVEKHGVTVLLSSHNMLEVEYLCDRVAIINKGRTVCEGTPDGLKKEFEAENLEEVFMKATEAKVGEEAYV